MSRQTILVLGDPAELKGSLPDSLEPAARFIIGRTVAEFEGHAASAQIILHRSGGAGLLKEAWALTPKLRWVHTLSAGVDTLLFPELIASPVILTNARGAYSASLAEFVMGAILYFAKEFRRMKINQEAGVWERLSLSSLAGSTLGIVGYGDIGRAVASRARSFGMKILALRRGPQAVDVGHPVDELFPPARKAELLARSDYITICAPLTPETRGLIGGEELAAMKTGAVLINVSRGAVVREDALAGALAAKRIRGAALDVFETEPLPSGHPFYALENVLLSPHCADRTPGALEGSIGVFLDNFERFLRGEPLRNLVDKKLGY